MATTTTGTYIDILSKIIDHNLFSVSCGMMHRTVGDYTIEIEIIDSKTNAAIKVAARDASYFTVASRSFPLGVGCRDCYTTPRTIMWYPAPLSDDKLEPIGAAVNAYIADLIDQFSSQPEGFRGEGAARLEYCDCAADDIPASIRCMAEYMQEHQLQSETLYAVIRYSERIHINNYDQHGRNLWADGGYGLRFRRYDRRGNRLEPEIDEADLEDAIEDNHPCLITTNRDEAYAALAGETSTRKIDGIYIRQEGVAIVSATIVWDAESETYGIPYNPIGYPTWKTEIAPVVKEYEKEEEED